MTDGRVSNKRQYRNFIRQITDSWTTQCRDISGRCLHLKSMSCYCHDVRGILYMRKVSNLSVLASLVLIAVLAPDIAINHQHTAHGIASFPPVRKANCQDLYYKTSTSWGLVCEYHILPRHIWFLHLTGCGYLSNWLLPHTISGKQTKKLVFQLFLAR